MRLSRLGLWSSCVLLLASAAMAGCAAPTDDDAGEGADAVSVARASVASTATRAREMADQLGRAGYREGGLFVLPVVEEGATIPSEAYGAWRAALVLDDTKRLVAFMLLPAKNAPSGAFGLLLVDGDRNVVALSAHVPDSAPEAARVAQKLLDALPTDGASLVAAAPGAVSTRGLLSPKVLSEGIEIAARLLHGLKLTAGSSKAAIAAEGTLAAKMETTMWQKLEATLPMSTRTNMVAQLAANRVAFGTRRVALVNVQDGIFSEATVWKALSLQYGSRTSKIGLAVPESVENAAVVTWALKNDVPIVVNSLGSKTPRELLESMLAMDAGSEAIARAALSDPKKLALLRVVESPKLGMNYVQEQAFVPLWSISDEAFAIVENPATDVMLPWFRRFAGAVFAMP